MDDDEGQDHQAEVLAPSPGNDLVETMRQLSKVPSNIPHPDEPLLTRALLQGEYPRIAEFDWAGPSDDWYVRGCIADTAGGLAISELLIYPRPGQQIRAGGLTREILRSIPLPLLLSVGACSARS